MKLFFVLLSAIGITAAAAATVATTPASSKTGKCLSACGKPSVDDIANIIRTHKIDVTSLWTKLGVDKNTGKPTTAKPTTAKPNLSAIQKSLLQKGTIDVATFTKSVSATKKITVRQIFELLSKQSKVPFNLKSISASVLNTSLNPATIISKLKSVKTKTASLPTIYNIIFPLISSGNPTTKPVTTAKPKTTTPSSVNLPAIRKSLPQSGTVDVAKLKKSVPTMKKPTFRTLLDLIYKLIGSKFNPKSLPSAVSNAPLTTALITKQLDKLKTPKANLQAIYDAIFPLIPSQQPVTSAPVSSTTASSSPVTKPSATKPKSKRVLEILFNLIPRKTSHNIPKLQKTISSLPNPNVGDILKVVPQNGGYNIDLSQLPSSILKKPVKAQLAIDALSTLKDGSSADDVLGKLLPVIFQGDESDDDDSAWPTTTAPSKSPVTSVPSTTASSKTSPSLPASDIVWNVISELLSGNKSLSISKLKKSILSWEDPTLELLFKRILCGAGIKFDTSSIPSSILIKPLIAEQITDALSPLNEEATLSEILDQIWTTVFNDENPDSGVSTPCPFSPVTTKAPTTVSPSTAAPVTPVAPVKPVTPISQVSPKPEDTLNVIFKSFSRRSKMNVTKFLQALATLENPTFEQFFQLIKQIAGIEINLSSVPHSVLALVLDKNSLQTTLNGFNGEITIPELFNAIWPVVENTWETNSSSSDGAWNVIFQTIPNTGTVNVDNLTSVEESYDSVAIRLPQTESFDLAELKESIDNMKGKNFGGFLESIGPAAGIIFDLGQVPSNILNIPMNIDAIESALNSLNEPTTIERVFDVVMPLFSGRWETTSSSSGQSNEAWRSVVITVPHVDETQSTTTAKSAPVKSILPAALSSIF